MKLTYLATAALAVALGLPALSLPNMAQAQNYQPYNSGYQDSNSNDYDGYCYARMHNAQTNGAVVGAVAGGAIGGTFSDTHHKGVGTAAGAVIGGLIGNQVGKSSVTCYNGDYYSYQSGYYAPPPAPDGYETVYFRDRPGGDYYQHYHTDRPAYAYDSGQSGYVTDNGAPGFTHYQNPPSAYQNNDGSDDSDTPPPPPPPSNYDNGYSGQPYHHYDDNSGYNSSSGNGDDQSYHDGYAHPHYAVAGWQDDQGIWHNGRPRAVGWQDDNGNWHTGQVVAYGWRDSQGGWHEESSSYQSSSYTSGN